MYRIHRFTESSSQTRPRFFEPLSSLGRQMDKSHTGVVMFDSGSFRSESFRSKSFRSKSFRSKSFRGLTIAATFGAAVFATAASANPFFLAPPAGSAIAQYEPPAAAMPHDTDEGRAGSARC